MRRMQELQLIEQLYRLATRLHSAFTARGIQISFKRIYTDRNEPQYGFFEVETVGLPSNLQPETLLNGDIEQFLSAAVEHPVKAINQMGLTYCVKLGAG